jgi:folate-binding Fe-S cluster repair protein YgfZ
MQNLKTIKIHSLKAHLDRLQDTAEALAQLGAGETIAGRLASSQELARLAVGLLAVKAAAEKAAEAVRGEITVNLEGGPQ